MLLPTPHPLLSFHLLIACDFAVTSLHEYADGNYQTIISVAFFCIHCFREYGLKFVNVIIIWHLSKSDICLQAYKALMKAFAEHNKVGPPPPSSLSFFMLDVNERSVCDLMFSDFSLGIFLMVFGQTHGLFLRLLLIIHLFSLLFLLKMRTGEEMEGDKEEMLNMITGIGQRSLQSWQQCLVKRRRRGKHEIGKPFCFTVYSSTSLFSKLLQQSNVLLTTISTL